MGRLIDRKKPAHPGLVARKSGQQDVVFLHDILRVPEPVVDQPEGAVGVRRGNAAASAVTADDDVFHAQHIHGVLDHCKAIQVRVDDDVGDIPVNEKVPRQEPDDLGRRDAAVRAPDPEVARTLLPGQGREEARIPRGDPGSPLPVVSEEILDAAHGTKHTLKPPAGQNRRPAVTRRGPSGVEKGMAAVKNGITLAGLCKEYRLGKTTVRALRHVDLEIKSGSFTCVAGPSGSGKTTLLNMIGLIDAPTSGTVHVAGEDIQGLPERLRTRYRSRTLGFIFQSFNLLWA